MHGDSLIGVLAIGTIGAFVLIAFGALGYFLRDPENRKHAHRTLISNEKSATTEHREAAGAHDDGLAPLTQRLNHSEASSHPYDPDNKPQGQAVAS